MDAGTNKKIRDFIALVKQNRDDLCEVYLFGSYAIGNDKLESDIDLAMVLDKLSDDDRFNLQVELMTLAANFDVRIEPHPIGKRDFNFSNPFAAEIIKTGIEITDKDPKYWLKGCSKTNVLNDDGGFKYNEKEE